MHEFLAFDIKTTGTVPSRDRIIEIGAARICEGKVVATFGTLIDPCCSIPPLTTRVHGITDEMVAGKPRIESALEEFAEFAQGATALVAHNAPFDFKFLAAAATACAVPLPSAPILDTYGLAKRVVPELFNHRLDSVVKHFSVQRGHFHRAEADAAMCGLVFLHLVLALKKRGEKLTLAAISEAGAGELRFPEIAPQPRQMALF